MQLLYGMDDDFGAHSIYFGYISDVLASTEMVVWPITLGSLDYLGISSKFLSFNNFYILSTVYMPSFDFSLIAANITSRTCTDINYG